MTNKILSSKNIIFIFLSISILIGTSIYYIFKRIEDNSIDKIKWNLKSQSNLFLSVLEQNITQYEKILNENKKESDQDYVNIHKKLNHSLEKVYPSIKFVYTIYKKNEKILFGLDASKLGDNDHDGIEDHAFAHTEYDKASDDLKNKFKEKKDFYTEFYSDNWGTFLSYYNPIFNERNEFLGFIGVDLEVKSYLNDLNKIKQISLYLFFSIRNNCFSWINFNKKIYR